MPMMECNKDPNLILKILLLIYKIVSVLYREHAYEGIPRTIPYVNGSDSECGYSTKTHGGFENI